MNADVQRDAAIARLQAKRNFANRVVAYLGVNVMLVVVWLLTGGGFFWPVFVAVGWGAALVAQAWSLFRAMPITEADVEREIAEDSRHADAVEPTMSVNTTATFSVVTDALLPPAFRNGKPRAD